LKVLHTNDEEWNAFELKTEEKNRKKVERKNKTITRKNNQLKNGNECESGASDEDLSFESDSEMEEWNIQISNQEAFQQTAVSLLKSRLSQYDTSLEEDMELLKSSAFISVPSSETSPSEVSLAHSKKRKAVESVEPPIKKQKIHQLSYNQRNALIVRISEKTILNQHLQRWQSME